MMNRKATPIRNLNNDMGIQGASPDILILRPCRAAEKGFQLGPELRRRPKEKRQHEAADTTRHGGHKS